MSFLKSNTGFHTALSAESGVLFTSQHRYVYEFENFFHPYVGEIIARLNRESLPGIYDGKFQESLHTANPTAADDFFTLLYHPQEAKDVHIEHFRKEIDVSPEGSYSNYNWELFFHIPLTVAVHL